MIGYASRTGTKKNLAALREHGWRLLVSAMGPHRNEGFPYAIDNGAWSAYTQGKPFNEPQFIKLLASHGGKADWVALPDIVAGGHASLEFSLRWMRRVLDESPRALLPVQDGVSRADIEPFLGDRVGVFVGGSTKWKLESLPTWGGVCAGRFWLHVGRVNSARRIGICSHYGATSFDGTNLSRFSKNVVKLTHAVQQQPLFRGDT